MKICLISFDHWGYDKHIVKALQEQDVEAYHINTGSFRYKYPSPLHRVSNFIQKIFLGKNIKKIKRNQFILDELSKLGSIDKILVINPELIPVDIHRKIKMYTHKYIAYLYDSCARYSVHHLMDNIFDRIYSFDPDDVAQFNFLPITNYIYLDKKTIRPVESLKYKAFIILSKDERLPVLNLISTKLDEIGVNYEFIVVTSKRADGLNSNITQQRQRLLPAETEAYLDDSLVLIDLIRPNQVGLSFRVFEALAHQKKLITTNATIKKYDFYNPENILVIDPDNVVIDKVFFDTPYIPLEESIYSKYTIKSWTQEVFGLLTP
jgi:hypothetical protein